MCVCVYRTHEGCARLYASCILDVVVVVVGRAGGVREERAREALNREREREREHWADAECRLDAH